MMNLKKGNQVKILVGKDKGKTGEILEINRKSNLVKVKSIYFSSLCIFTISNPFSIGILFIIFIRLFFRIVYELG